MNKPKSRELFLNSLREAMRKSKTSPVLLFRALRIQMEQTEDEIVRCKSEAEIKKKLEALDKKVILMRKAALRSMKRFTRTLAATGFRDGRDRARRAMRKKGIHYPGEEKK